MIEQSNQQPVHCNVEEDPRHQLWLIYCRLKDAESDGDQRLEILQDSREELGKVINQMNRRDAQVELKSPSIQAATLNCRDRQFNLTPDSQFSELPMRQCMSIGRNTTRARFSELPMRQCIFMAAATMEHYFSELPMRQCMEYPCLVMLLIFSELPMRQCMIDAPSSELASFSELPMRQCIGCTSLDL